MASAETSPPKPAVFISYSRKDSATFAQELAKALKLGGFQPLLDVHDIAPGEGWEARLGGLIQKADTVVFVVSPEAITSTQCAWEIEKTIALAKKLLPVMHINVPDSELIGDLRQRQFIPFHKLTFMDGITRLIEAIRLDLEWVREHTRLTEAAATWAVRGRPASLLLYGDALADVRSWVSRRSQSAPQFSAALQEYISASEAAESVRLADESRRQAEFDRSKHLTRINLHKNVSSIAWDNANSDPASALALGVEAVGALTGC